jgi:hypothetical protein
MRRYIGGAGSSAKPFAYRLRRRRPRPGDKWHMDEVFIRIQGVQRYLWRAVDQDGVVLDILVQPRRGAEAAKRFFRRTLKGLQYVSRVIVTDKLRSHGVAHRELLPTVEHRQSRYLSNRAENSHRPTRRGERQMQRFKSPKQDPGRAKTAIADRRHDAGGNGAAAHHASARRNSQWCGDPFPCEQTAPTPPDFCAALCHFCAAEDFATERWLRSSEQFSANDKWVPAGFVAECRVCRDVGRAKPDRRRGKHDGGKFMPPPPWVTR